MTEHFGWQTDSRGWIAEILRNTETGEITTGEYKPQPLTEDEIISISSECASSHQHMDIEFARAIERAHGINQINVEETA